MTVSILKRLRSVVVLRVAVVSLVAVLSVDARGEDADPTSTGRFQFAPPRLLETDEGPIQVESPGYAAPCWADLDQDGVHDLLVGQFRNGQIKVYKHRGDLKFDEGQWLQADGEVAQVPGVW